MAKGMATQTKEGKNIYQQYYMRVVRATDEEKQSLRTVLHEVLALHFTLEKYVFDGEKSSHIAVSVEPNFELLPDHSRKNVKVFLGVDGKPSLIVEKYYVNVPSENKLDALIPFYRDCAVAFFGKYKTSGISLAAIEKVMRTFQSLKLEDLKDIKETLIGTIEKMVFHRINQESVKASRMLREAFNLNETGGIQKLEEYRKNDDKRSKFWLLCMLHLRKERFGFFESNLATNSLVFGDKFINEVIDGVEPFRQTVGEWLDSYGLDGFEDPRVEEWRESESKGDVAKKELVFSKQREKQLLNEKVEKVIAKAKRKWLIQFIEAGGSRDQLLLKEAKSSPKTRRKTLKMYESLLKEGFVETVTLGLKEVSEFVTIESVSDAETKAKEFDEMVTALIIAGLTEGEMWRRLRQHFWWLGGDNTDLWKGRIRNIRKAYDASQVTPNSQADNDKSEIENGESEKA